jgi:hypothetical protein
MLTQLVRCQIWQNDEVWVQMALLRTSEGSNFEGDKSDHTVRNSGVVNDIIKDMQMLRLPAS